jgi:hypothetical protein
LHEKHGLTLRTHLEITDLDEKVRSQAMKIVLLLYSNVSLGEFVAEVLKFERMLEEGNKKQ